MSGLNYNKWDRLINPDWEPDALVSFYLLTEKEGGRNKPAFNGYRPQYKVLPDYQTSASHFFLMDEECLLPGRSEKAFVTFLSPEAYPNCLKINQVIDVYEGARLIAKSTIIEIYNELLLSDDTN